MKTAKGYRYTIQFASISPQHEAVGEYLESLKNKKAECIVRAVSEYMRRGSDSASNAADAGESTHMRSDATVESPLTDAQSVPDTQLDAMLNSLDQW